MTPSPLDSFHPPVRDWFRATFREPTRAQTLGWRAIASGRSTLLLAPTGSGKTLAAFLHALDRLSFRSPGERGTSILYISPIKALAVDVERNLRAPIAGILDAARRSGSTDPATPAARVPTIGIRSGDTSPAERARLVRSPPDILITTPESLYLLLTSRARETLRSVDTVIIDEIHAVAATKRGSHLALSLERLERLRDPAAASLQRIGLSATQRPLEEIARLLGGGTVQSDETWRPRPVEIVDAGEKKPIELRVAVPVEDMARLGESIEREGGASLSPEERSSIWTAIHPELVELIRAHRSTMVFVNSRRLAERLSAALNETAGEEIACAHHGSVALSQRQEIEDRLKRGDLPAIVATSSMELGVDMGAVDLVVQIEAPPSVASGMQRIGRANHQVGETPRGVIFPKFRGDLLACAATAACLLEGRVEPTRYPRNPLDVLSQQMVATVALEPIDVEELWRLVRGAAPFAELPRSAFDGVLDMLSGRYPSDELRELKARVTWDRLAGRVQARRGAQRLCVTNAGTIPDRGLYGVFLAGGDEKTSRRVGELDEEMVFETHVGDVFLLGASSWRVEEITHDRVLVTPAPGEPGKMPFWHGDGPGRPLELGEEIGRLTRELARDDVDVSMARLRSRGLDENAARNAIAYVRDQGEATGSVPSDRTLLVERFLDEVGDWRVCVLSPFGARVHAAWANAVASCIEEDSSLRIETVWTDDGIVFRLPDTGEPLDLERLVPRAAEAESLIARRLFSTALFAARFRENAARALLLPRHRPGRRQPLWVQRRRAADLLAVASRFPEFPLVLETYRECLQDVLDVDGLRTILSRIERRDLRIVHVETQRPSPFASAVLFSYVANFMYESDAPAAERRAQTLSIDHAQLRELLGERELRELFDPEDVLALERSLQRLERPSIRDEDDLHDSLLALGDLTESEIAARCRPDAAPRDETRESSAPQAALEIARRLASSLERSRRAFCARVAGESRLVAVEDAARYRDALGVVAPGGLPSAHLEPVERPLVDLISRFARTHGPFATETVSARLGLSIARTVEALRQLESEGRIASGAFLRHGTTGEWCDAGVLRTLKRRALARLRAEVEPVEPEVLSRLLLEWQGISRPRVGLEALLDVIEQLEGSPLIASELETRILPARVRDYEPGLLDELCACGEIVWRGIEPVGTRDGRVAFYSRDRYALLAPEPDEPNGPAEEIDQKILAALSATGASFFSALERTTGIYRGELVERLWALVWSGRITNDTLAPLRSFLRSNLSDGSRRRAVRGDRRSLRESRTRLGPPGSEGRWSLLAPPSAPATERALALATTLLERHGVLTREAIHAERVPGGFAAIYPVLKALEESGRTRRGYFVAGLGATQFAIPGADDRLRALRDVDVDARAAAVILAATDPASPWGAVVPWPETGDTRCERRAGARVILHGGALVAYLSRTGRELTVFLPEVEPARRGACDAIAGALAESVASDGRRAFLLERVDGGLPGDSPIAPALEAAGFRPGPSGWLFRAARGDDRRRGRIRLETGPDAALASSRARLARKNEDLLDDA